MRILGHDALKRSKVSNAQAGRGEVRNTALDQERRGRSAAGIYARIKIRSTRHGMSPSLPRVLIFRTAGLWDGVAPFINVFVEGEDLDTGAGNALGIACVERVRLERSFLRQADSLWINAVFRQVVSRRHRSRPGELPAIRKRTAGGRRLRGAYTRTSTLLGFPRNRGIRESNLSFAVASKVAASSAK